MGRRPIDGTAGVCTRRVFYIGKQSEIGQGQLVSEFRTGKPTENCSCKLPVLLDLPASVKHASAIVWSGPYKHTITARIDRHCVGTT